MRNTLLHAFGFVFALAIGANLILYGLNRYQPRGYENPPVLIPPKQIGLFTLGYSELVADMLWLRVIQDFDFCENRTYGLASYDASSAKCKDGWVYSMVDAITELAPRFKPAYKSGALFLSVLVNDAAGASAILEKAVRMFPYDWNLFYIAAYQAMAEENDSAKASRLLVRAGQLGAPSWVFPLAARLSLKEGQLELSKSILESALSEPLTPEVEKRVRERLDQVNRQISNSK